MLTRPKLCWGIVAFLLAGCVSEGTDFDAQPFYRADRIAIGEGVDGRTAPQVRRKSPIALFREKRSADDRRVRLTLGYPLLTYKRDNNNTKLQFLTGIPAAPALLSPGRDAAGAGPRTRKLPLTAYSVSEQKGEDDFDEDTGFLPFFAYGSDEEEGGYLTVAPFGGTMKGLLGKDDLLWIGFPLPFYLYARDGEFESRHVLFPFVNWVNGDGRSGFRVFPLYGHYERRDDDGRLAYDRTWLLWPFITWQTNGANLMKTGPNGEEVAEDPTKVFAVLPLFGVVTGPQVFELDFLYPFFRYSSFTQDKGWELRAPFPFLIFSGDEAGRSRYDLWPFFGVRKRPGYVRHFALWPIERYENRDDDWVKDVLFEFLPFFQYHDHLDRKSGATYNRVQLWPFFHYRQEADGSTDFQSLSMLLFRNEDAEELLNPFFTLYRHREIPRLGSSETNMLLGLASWRTVRPGEASGPAPGTVNPYLEGSAGEGNWFPEDYDRVSLLFGMFQYRRKGREKGLRFFYLPEWPVWEAD